MSDTINNTELYSNHIIRTYELLIKSKYSYINFTDVLRYADMSDYQSDTNIEQWFKQKQINQFYDRLVQLTGNENIGYEAGMYTTSPEAIGKYRIEFLSLGNPLSAYLKIENISKKLTKSSTYTVKQLTDSSVKITVTRNQGINEQPFQCKNRQGIFVGIYHIFDNTKEPTITHPADKCMFTSDGDTCEYEILWDLPRSVKWKKAQTICKHTIPIIFILAFLSYLFVPLPLYTYFIGLFILLLSYFQISKHVSDIQKDDIKNQLDIKSTSFIAEINKHYNTSLIIKEIGQALSTERDLDGILKQVSTILDNRFEFDRGVIMLSDERKNYLKYEESFGYTPKQVAYWDLKKGFKIRPDAKGPFVVSFMEKRPYIVNDVSKIRPFCSKRTKKLLDNIGIKAFMCYPIFFGHKSLGIIAVDNYKTNREIMQYDINLLAGIAHQIALSIIANETAVKSVRENLAMRAVHNIRNPAYTLALNISHLMEKKEYVHSDNDVKEVLEESVVSIKRIQDLASDFLKYLKPIELRSTNVNISNFLKKVRDTIVSKPKCSVELFIDEQANEVWVDESGLLWVFEELLENAFKHRKKDKLLKIVISVKKNHEKLIITFQDNGLGIPKNIQNKIFDPFYSSDRNSGTGLGLTNIKRIIEENSGVFFLDTSYNDGASFIIEFSENQKMEGKNYT